MKPATQNSKFQELTHLAVKVFLIAFFIGALRSDALASQGYIRNVENGAGAATNFFDAEEKYFKDKGIYTNKADELSKYMDVTRTLRSYGVKGLNIETSKDKKDYTVTVKVKSSCRFALYYSINKKGGNFPILRPQSTMERNLCEYFQIGKLILKILLWLIPIFFCFKYADRYQKLHSLVWTYIIFSLLLSAVWIIIFIVTARR